MSCTTITVDIVGIPAWVKVDSAAWNDEEVGICIEHFETLVGSSNAFF